MRLLLMAIILVASSPASAQLITINDYNPVWTTQSKNSSESMPCGGGDIGLNVWVENGELLLYISRSGTFDENNAMLKLGRVRVKLSPNPLSGNNFRQELILKDGYINIQGNNGNLSAQLNIWVDVFRPIIHIDIKGSQPMEAETSFENWRYQDRASKGKANNSNSYKWASQFNVQTYKDIVDFDGKAVLFYHKNKDSSVFDVTVAQQGLDGVKEQLQNPLKHLIFGGNMQGKNMMPAGTYSGTYQDTDYMGWKLKSTKPSRSHNITLCLNADQKEDLADWKADLLSIQKDGEKYNKTAQKATRNWWQQYWRRSYIAIEPDKPNENSEKWQVGRNYQLFRYMLGCNAYGKYPTKFNGGLFTYDPVFTDSTIKSTPDHRNWGGGTMTAQNQRLVYFPMLKSGDIDMMKPQFDFYLRSLRTAELRSEIYWNHSGACFAEQIEIFGLPNCTEYGWKRPAAFDKGLEYNAWLEYEWDTVLEFCMMILETERYANKDITAYVPLVKSSLRFFNEHYQYQARKRGSKAFDGNGHLILFPGSGAETYKMAYNATSTIAALKTVLTRLLELPANYVNEEEKKEWTTMLHRVPPITFSEFNGHKTIAPAKLWERINNTETSQLYPLFPWGIYGIGRPDLDVAINTWKYDTSALKFRSHVGWKQDNIFTARMGLTEEAMALNTLKLKNSGRRFPAFWGPGFDWVPDHNWGGSGMIGIQEMLLQVDGEKIYLLPSWPKDLDVNFKLHAPYSTTVEGVYKNGKMESLKVVPESRKKDIVL